MPSSVNKRLLDLLREVNAQLEQTEKSVAYWKEEYKKVNREHMELLSSLLCEECRVRYEGELCSRCSDKRFVNKSVYWSWRKC